LTETDQPYHGRGNAEPELAHRRANRVRTSELPDSRDDQHHRDDAERTEDHHLGSSSLRGDQRVAVLPYPTHGATCPGGILAEGDSAGGSRLPAELRSQMMG